MRITIYNAELSKSQELTIDALNDIVVRPALINPSVVATMTTALGQAVKVTIDIDGIIRGIELKEI